MFVPVKSGFPCTVHCNVEQLKTLF